MTEAEPLKSSEWSGFTTKEDRQPVVEPKIPAPIDAMAYLRSLAFLPDNVIISKPRSDLSPEYPPK